MSTRELRRAEVLGRVKSKTLRLTDAAKILELSYRRTKRLWKRYRGEGAKGLQHRSAGAATQGIQDYEAANAHLQADGPASRRVLFHPCASL
jgi:transposase